MSSPCGIEKFIRPDLIALGGYSTHKSPDTLKSIPPDKIVKIDANENPYGCSPRVQKALSAYKKYNIYPDAGQSKLRQLLQTYAGVDASNIIAANGSGELLNDILCLLLEPGDEVVNCIPTFDLYRLRTLINRGKLVNVLRSADDFSVDVKAVKTTITKKTKLIILTNPNNPTGNVMPASDIEELLDTGIPVLVDEAYYEFCGETVISLVSKYPNLMVLRTLSKWAGLAGLRIGYGVLPSEMVNYILKIKMPYNVNVAVPMAVEESLKDIDYLQKNVKVIIAERERMTAKLKKLPFLKVYPSRANFIFCSVLEGEAKKIQQELQDRGILVRYFDQPLVKNGIRFSVGKPEHTDALITALKEISSKI